MAEKYPDRFIPCCNIDPRAMSNSPFAPLERPLKYYKERGCKILGEVMPGLDLLDDAKTAQQIVQRCISKGYGRSRAKQALFEK